jgi:molybdate transport system substrate-binding protein
MRRWLGLLIFLAGCAGRDEPRLMAAASLQHVLPEILAATGVEAVESYASSSTLARQIELGAEADLFVSADRAWIEYLAGQGYLAEPEVIAHNELVVWARKGERPLERPAELEGERWRRIAVGDEAAPVGRYARAALSGLALEDRFVSCRDAPSVLRTLETGEVDAGIAYLTDGRGLEDLEVIWRFGSTPEVSYWALRVTDRPESKLLLDALRGDTARALFSARGFR